MANELKIGIIGLDTSHVVAFTELLNNPDHEYHVPGGKVVVAYPGGSPDLHLSYSRVDGFKTELEQKYGVQMVDSPEAVAEASDAILLESVDGRVHLEQFRKIASYGKPVFIDKPFTTSSADARAIAELAKQHNVPLMSSSSLRYAEGLTAALNNEEKGAIISADTYGPMALEEAMPGYYWYGVHAVEMLFKILGPGCEYVTAAATDDHDVVIGVWKDGRIGTVRGNRKGNHTFGATIHREKGSDYVDVYAYKRPYYSSLLEHVMHLFRTGQADVSVEETIHMMRFIEAANEARVSGQRVTL